MFEAAAAKNKPEGKNKMLANRYFIILTFLPSRKDLKLRSNNNQLPLPPLKPALLPGITSPCVSAIHLTEPRLLLAGRNQGRQFAAHQFLLAPLRSGLPLVELNPQLEESLLAPRLLLPIAPSLLPSPVLCFTWIHFSHW